MEVKVAVNADRVHCTSITSSHEELVDQNDDQGCRGCLEMHYACIEAIKAKKYDVKAVTREIDLYATALNQHICISVDEYVFDYNGQPHAHQLMTCSPVFDQPTAD